MPRPARCLPPRRLPPRRLSLALVATACALSACTPPGVPSGSEETVAPAVPAGTPAPEVAVNRDGVAHVRAASLDGVYFGLGWVTARDRAGQLELLRLTAEGRSAEMLGNDGLRSDGFIRSLDIMGRARALAAGLRSRPFARRALTAYAAGINARFDSLRAGLAPLPRDLRLAGVRPGRWTPAHSLAVVLLQGLNQDAYFPQLQYAALAEKIGDSLAAAAWAREPLVAYWTVEDSLVREPEMSPGPGAVAAAVARPAPGAAAAAEAGARLAAEVPPHGPGASNAWAVGGARTRRGAALLANDTHLGLVAPSVWYATHLTVPDSLDVTGLQVPGLPFITSGRNRDLAWGVTALGAMSFEVYSESLDASGRRARFRGRWEPLRSRPLGLSYRLGPLRFPLFWIRAQYTRHGVVEGLDRKHRRAYAIRWAALEPWPSPPADFGWERARTLEEFRLCLAGIYAPTLNWVAAERSGRVLHQTAGWLPRRAYTPGPRPTPGFDGDHEWGGRVPLDSMPHVLRGPDGVIVNCNNAPSGPGTFPSVGQYTSADWRARRVRERLGERRGLTAADCETLQGDALSPQWAVFGPVMLAQARRASGLPERERSILTALAAWTGEAVPGKVEPTVFRAWWNELNRSLRSPGREALLLAVLGGDEPAAWLQGPEGARRQGGARAGGATSTADAVAAALTRALDGLEAKLGADPRGWDWARTHRARFRHELEKRDATLSPRSVAVRGDRAAVCVGSVALPRDTVVTHGPTLRVIFDLADSSGWFALPPGNSGDPDSPHYDDLLAAWAELRYRRMDLAWPAPEETERYGRVEIPPAPAD